MARKLAGLQRELHQLIHDGHDAFVIPRLPHALGIIEFEEGTDVIGYGLSAVPLSLNADIIAAIGIDIFGANTQGVELLRSIRKYFVRRHDFEL